MTLHPIPVDEHSPFVGESCALCKEPFQANDLIVVCPEDAVRHHRHCWVANGNRCTAYGCTGAGSLGDPVRPGHHGGRPRAAAAPVVTVIADDSGRPASRVKVMPARTFSCAQSCLVLAIAVTILLVALSCFGLWAILDFVAMELLGWHYREPAGTLPWGALLLTARLWLPIGLRGGPAPG